MQLSFTGKNKGYGAHNKLGLAVVPAVLEEAGFVANNERPVAGVVVFADAPTVPNKPPPVLALVVGVAVLAGAAVPNRPPPKGAEVVAVEAGVVPNNPPVVEGADDVAVGLLPAVLPSSVLPPEGAELKRPPPAAGVAVPGVLNREPAVPAGEGVTLPKRPPPALGGGFGVPLYWKPGGGDWSQQPNMGGARQAW